MNSHERATTITLSLLLTRCITHRRYASFSSTGQVNTTTLSFSTQHVKFNELSWKKNDTISVTLLTTLRLVHQGRQTRTTRPQVSVRSMGNISKPSHKRTTAIVATGARWQGVRRIKMSLKACCWSVTSSHVMKNKASVTCRGKRTNKQTNKRNTQPVPKKKKKKKNDNTGDRNLVF